MKKIIVFLLTAVLCLSTLSIAMAAAHEGLHAEIYPIEKYTPVIDGELDPQYQYSRVVNLRDNGPDFATGKIYYLWDDTRLYFFVEINDTTPSNPDLGVSHESDCIEMLFSVYNFDITADNIKAKQPGDIGDSQFRVFRDKRISACESITDNGITYLDGSHGGFGKWVFDVDYENTNDPRYGASYIIHWSDNAIGYGFEGFVKWSPELLYDEAHPIEKDLIIGLGIQVNDDNNGDNVRDKKCYSENAGPNDWSMSGNRATCGKFQLVDNGYNASNANANKPLVTRDGDTKAIDNPEEDPNAGTNVPPLGDISVIFGLLSVISAGGFTVCAVKKSKRD